MFNTRKIPKLMLILGTLSMGKYFVSAENFSEILEDFQNREIMKIFFENRVTGRQNQESRAKADCPREMRHEEEAEGSKKAVKEWLEELLHKEDAEENEGTEEARGDKEAEGDEEAKETQGLPAKIRRNAVPILGAGLGAFV